MLPKSPYLFLLIIILHYSLRYSGVKHGAKQKRVKIIHSIQKLKNYYDKEKKQCAKAWHMIF